MNDEEKLIKCVEESHTNRTGYYMIGKKAVEALGWGKAAYISLMKEMAELYMHLSGEKWFAYKDEDIFRDIKFDITDRHKINAYRQFFEFTGVLETKETLNGPRYKLNFLNLNILISERSKS